MKRKNNMGNKLRVLVFATVLIAVLGFTTLTNAALVTYQFSGTITDIYPSEAGFPSILNGVQVGSTFYGSYSYDTATLPSQNPYGGPWPYASATCYYEVPNTLSLVISSISVPIPGNTLDVFVWNNVDRGLLLGVRDGYDVQQVGRLGDPYSIQLANWILPMATFDDGSLPTKSIGPLALMIYSTSVVSQNVYLEGTIAAINPVPVPPGIWLIGSGLLGLFGMRRKLR